MLEVALVRQNLTDTPPAEINTVRNETMNYCLPQHVSAGYLCTDCGCCSAAVGAGAVPMAPPLMNLTCTTTHPLVACMQTCQLAWTVDIMHAWQCQSKSHV